MLRSFIVKLSILTGGLALMIVLLNYAVPLFNSVKNFTWLSIAFFFTLTIITGYIGFRSLEKSAYGFVASVNGIVLIKLLLCVGFVIAYLVIARPHAPDFVISFFILYIIYTVFEIRELVIAQRKRSGKEKVSQQGNV